MIYRFGFQILVICIHDLEWIRQMPMPKVEPYQIRWATREEVMAAADGSPDWLEPAGAAAALDRGDRCMGAFLNGRMMACSWSTRSGPICRGMAIHVPADHVYGHEAKTRKDCRGKGLYAGIVLTGAKVAAEAGKHMVGYVYVGNSQAVSGSARMGKMRRGFVVCREGREPWAWVSPLCRREGIWVARTEVRDEGSAVGAKT